MNKSDRILITGGTGLLGKALHRFLLKEKYTNIKITSSTTYELTNAPTVAALFATAKPDYVFHCAGWVRGIGGNMANQSSGYLKNLRINTNVIEACSVSSVKKVVAAGTGAVYPAKLPGGLLNEKFIFDGEPHESEYGYAMAKRALLAHLKVCERQFGLKYAYAVLTNLYGFNDRFDAENGHAIPSLIKKFHEAKTKDKRIEVWGTGRARRDFMHADDAARAMVLAMEKTEGSINIATGEVRTIFSVVEALQRITGIHSGMIDWNNNKPDGAMLRSFDLTKLNNLGFKPEVLLDMGLRSVFEWFEENHGTARK